MKKFILLQARFSALSVLLFFLCHNSTIAQGFSPQTQAALQQVIQSFQSNPFFVGGISAAIKVDGLASWQGATGYAARNVDASNNLLPGGTPFQTATLSRIYSVTKTFTAALALELSKAGIIHLDQPIGNYLPMNLINPGLNATVTLRQLLAHESGYSNYTDEMQFLISVAFQPTHTWTPFEVASFVHQVSQPGAERRYSSTNYVLLGAVIEAVTGQPVETHYRTRFLTPLGLNSMYLGVRESQPAGTTLAAPHDNISAFNPIFQFTGQPTFPNAYTNISAFPFQGIVSAAFTGGGLVSSASDLAEWGNALFTGQATSQWTINEMMASISPIPDAQGDHLGYGIWKSTKMSSTETFIGHDGNAPGYRSVMFFQPDKKLTLVVLTNFNGADIYAIAKALYAALPEFTCGNPNKKEDKIKLCYKGNTMCVSRNAADGFIEKGAYLGGCNNAELRPSSGSIIDARMVKDNVFHAYPNPSAGKVQFNFTADVQGPVSLDLYDMNGKLVLQLFHGVLGKGATKHIVFERKNLPSGTYVSSLKTLSGTRQQKIVLVN